MGKLFISDLAGVTRYIAMEVVQMNRTNNVLKIAPGKISGIKQRTLIEGIIKFSRNKKSRRY